MAILNNKTFNQQHKEKGKIKDHYVKKKRRSTNQIDKRTITNKDSSDHFKIVVKGQLMSKFPKLNMFKIDIPTFVSCYSFDIESNFITNHHTKL